MLQPLELTVDDSGTSSAPLFFRADYGAKPVFTAGVRLSGLEKVNEKLWKTFIPQVAYYKWYFEQLYVNDNRATRARTPDDGFYFVNSVTETVGEQGAGRSPEVAIQKIFLDSTDAACFNSFTSKDFEDAVVTFYHNWDNTRKHLLNFDRKQSAIYTAGEGMKPWNPLNNKSRWFVDNFKGALNAPGEWFLERSGTLYYIPRGGETIENTSFFAPLLENFITIRGDEATGKQVANIRFENIAFKVAGYQMPYIGNEATQAEAPANA